MALKKTMLKLGLASIPVQLGNAVKDDKETELKTLCPGTDTAPHPPIRVKSLMRCPTCSREEPHYSKFSRGRDNGDGTFTVLSDDDLDAIAVDSTITEAIYLMPRKVDQVDRRVVPAGRLYFIVPVGADPNYALFRDMIARRTDLAFLALFAMRSAPAQFRVIVMGDCLALQELAGPELIQNRPHIDLPAYDQRMLKMAEDAADALVEDYDPATFADTRKAKLAEILAGAQPVAGGTVAVADVALAPADNPMLKALAETAGRSVDETAAAGQAAKGKRAPAKRAVVKPLRSANKTTPAKRAAKKTAAGRKTA